MRAALPPVSVQTPQLQAPAPMPVAAAGWAADFMSMSTDLSVTQKQPQHQAQAVNTTGPVQIQPGVTDASAGVVHSPPPLVQSGKFCCSEISKLFFDTTSMYRLEFNGIRDARIHASNTYAATTATTSINFMV